MEIPGSNWRDKALCATSPDAAHWAFGDSEDEDEKYGDSRAKAFAVLFCLECPVMMQCKAWVDKHPQEYGVFGGELAHDRNGTTEEDS